MALIIIAYEFFICFFFWVLVVCVYCIWSDSGSLCVHGFIHGINYRYENWLRLFIQFLLTADSIGIFSVAHMALIIFFQ